MPIWFEIVALMLACYTLGIGIGWAIWGRDTAHNASTPEPEEKEF